MFARYGLAALIIAAISGVLALAVVGAVSLLSPPSAKPSFEGSAKGPQAAPDIDALLLGTATPEPPVLVPILTPAPPTATAAPATATPAPATATAVPATPESNLVAPTAAPRPPASAPDAPDFSGAWRIVDTVTAGIGAGQSFSFDVVLTQSGSMLSGGNGGISMQGRVDGDTASLQFSQPALGYTGTFVWTWTGPGTARGSFTTSAPNSGSSDLVRLQ